MGRNHSTLTRAFQVSPYKNRICRNTGSDSSGVRRKQNTPLACAEKFAIARLTRTYSTKITRSKHEIRTLHGNLSLHRTSSPIIILYPPWKCKLFLLFFCQIQRNISRNFIYIFVYYAQNLIVSIYLAANAKEKAEFFYTFLRFFRQSLQFVHKNAL